MIDIYKGYEVESRKSKVESGKSKVALLYQFYHTHTTLDE